MSICPRCRAEFTCCMNDAPAAAPCWCTALAPLPRAAYRSDSDCFCPQCLRELVAEKEPAGAADEPKAG